MGLFVDTTHETDWARGQWRGLAESWQRAGHVELVGSAREADTVLITLADCRSSYPEAVASIARSGSYAEYPDKCFVFDTQDSPIGLYPGLYCSLRRYLFSAARHRTGCYMQSFNEFVAPDAEARTGFRWLFSFQGNITSAVRGRLLATAYGRDDVLIEKTEPFWRNIGAEEHRGFKQQYAQNLLLSRFVLCPRGVGTSSYRLFETLQSGRVPVILSDAWVAPSWFDWRDCALRVAEKDVARLPEICLEALPRWEGMARQARRLWERWFSPSGMGELVAASIADIRRTRRLPEAAYRLGWPARRAAVSLRQGAVRAISRLRQR
jgi:hypothetical protein